MARPTVLRRTTAFACLVLALAGCSPAPLSYPEAEQRYEATMHAVVAALEAAYPEVAWSVDRQTRASDATGECRLHVATRTSDRSVREAAGGWDQVWTVVNPALTANGFAAIDGEQDFDGGWTGGVSQDDRQGRLQISAKVQSSIMLSAPLAVGDC
jgi:hypothetical protein